VQDYVAAAETAQPFLDKSSDLLTFLIPHYMAEGKSYLTIGVGCTGGRHRSVAHLPHNRCARPRSGRRSA